MLRRCFALIVALAAVWSATPSFSNDLQFNDPLHEQQWYLRAMRFDAAWAMLQAAELSDESLMVAVIDSGFDLDHPDLAENVLTGHNIVDGSDDVGPLTAHGTGTTGPIGAISNNALGISQAAWPARVLPIRVTNRPDGRARTGDIAKAIRYAADRGARVINVSYGGVQLASINAACQYARQRGSLVVMPAGNDGQHQQDWKRQPHVIAVGAITHDGRRASFSNHGRFVDFVAPGEGVTSLYPNQGYARWNGTSFASPLVSAAAALVVAANPTLTPEQIYDVLSRAADDEARHADTLPGVIDVARAVALALNEVGQRDTRPASAAPATAAAPAITARAMKPATRAEASDSRLQSPAGAAEADLLQSPQGYVVNRLKLGQTME